MGRGLLQVCQSTPNFTNHATCSELSHCNQCSWSRQYNPVNLWFLPLRQISKSQSWWSGFFLINWWIFTGIWRFIYRDYTQLRSPARSFWISYLLSYDSSSSRSFQDRLERWFLFPLLCWNNCFVLFFKYTLPEIKEHPSKRDADLCVLPSNERGHIVIWPCSWCCRIRLSGLCACWVAWGNNVEYMNYYQTGLTLWALLLTLQQRILRDLSGAVSVSLRDCYSLQVFPSFCY